MDDPTEVKALVWANVETLMKRHYGGPNLTRLGKDTGIKQGGSQRLSNQDNVGIVLIAKVAKFFKIDPWQLMADNLGESMRLSPEEIEAIRKMRDPLQPKGATDIPNSTNQQASNRPGIRKTAQQKRRRTIKKQEK